METTEKNRFSILLDQLINTGEVKNASLAAALRYDASYISKWITGRMIPAEKTKRKVLRGISQEMVRQSTQSGSMIIWNRSIIMFWNCRKHMVHSLHRR